MSCLVEQFHEVSFKIGSYPATSSSISNKAVCPSSSDTKIKHNKRSNDACTYSNIVSLLNDVSLVEKRRGDDESDECMYMNGPVFKKCRVMLAKDLLSNMFDDDLSCGSNDSSDSLPPLSADEEKVAFQDSYKCLKDFLSPDISTVPSSAVNTSRILATQSFLNDLFVMESERLVQ